MVKRFVAKHKEPETLITKTQKFSEVFAFVNPNNECTF